MKQGVVLTILVAIIFALLGGCIVKKRDVIIRRTNEYLYVKEYGWYNRDSVINKYKADKLHVGVLLDKRVSRSFVGVAGKGGHAVTSYFVTIKFDNRVVEKNNSKIYYKYERGDKVSVRESWYPYYRIQFQ